MKKKDLVIFGYDMIGDSNPWDAPEVELWIGEYKNSNFILVGKLNMLKLFQQMIWLVL